MPLWPATGMVDVCGQWAGVAVAVRVSDETMMELVREAIEPPIREGDELAKIKRDEANEFFKEHGVPRVVQRWRAIDLMGRRGIAPTTAMERIRSLHRRGLLEMGPAPEVCRKKWPAVFKGACIWLPMGEKAEPVAKISKADLDSKWVGVREALRLECPGPEKAKTFLTLLEICRAIDPTVSHGGLQRFIKRRVADGHMAHGPRGYYLARPPTPIEVD